MHTSMLQQTVPLSYQTVDGLGGVQETSERPGVLMAFIVLDSPAASLLDMRTVSFVEGQPRFSSYLEAFPFPYYIVLRDIAALPATLAGLVRQWMQLSTP